MKTFSTLGQAMDFKQIGRARGGKGATHGDDYQAAFLQHSGGQDRGFHLVDLGLGATLEIDDQGADPSVKAHSSLHFHGWGHGIDRDRRSVFSNQGGGIAGLGEGENRLGLDLLGDPAGRLAD